MEVLRRLISYYFRLMAGEMRHFAMMKIVPRRLGCSERGSSAWRRGLERLVSGGLSCPSGCRVCFDWFGRRFRLWAFYPARVRTVVEHD